MSDTNCPNCGAPLAGDTCEYCGTVVLDMACMDTVKPFWLKVKTDKDVVMYHCVLDTIDIRSNPDVIYADDLLYRRFAYDSQELTVNLRIVPNKHGVFKAYVEKGKTVNKNDPEDALWWMCD